MAGLTIDPTKVGTLAAGISSMPGNPLGQSSFGQIDRLRNFGATITAGQLVYLDPATNTWLLASANSSTPIARQAMGIALNGGASGNAAVVFRGGGIVNVGATTVVNTVYILAATSGGIAPLSDLTAGWYPSIIGIAIDTVGNLLCPLLPFNSPAAS